MLLNGIKNISAFCSSIIKRKNNKQGNGYLKPELQPNFPAGQNGQQGGQFPGNRTRLSRLRRAIAARRTSNYQGYKPAGKRKASIFKQITMTTVASVFLVFLFVGGGQLVMSKLESASFFQVSEIVISGTDTIPEDTLRFASGIVLHQTSLIGLNCTEIEAMLTAVPWVAKAEVNRNWPSTVEIVIEENIPVALLLGANASGAGLHYLDKVGNAFLQVEPGTELDFPVVTGLLEIEDPVLREQALKQSLVLLKKINEFKNPHLPGQSVSEVHLTPEGKMVVYLVEYPFPIFFGEKYNYGKHERLVRVLKALYNNKDGEGAITEIAYIQMDYLPNQVLVAQTESR